ncbi:sensor histidine kinase [Streptomyces beijiangensis]|uniref:histidine kinase n=1 Tax=Streptomyces beijiangensis TaxID=163361 RepID=A0A939JJ71_9ACTN|nr:sensor histidine kinase [Streptomyces beijiangensis]MBO0514442.1 sensor histidine kinase [Streptomyces beijiangensis]
MTQIPEALPWTVAVVMLAAAIVAVILLLRTRRSAAVARAEAQSTAQAAAGRFQAMEAGLRAEAAGLRAETHGAGLARLTAEEKYGRVVKEVAHLTEARLPALVTHLRHRHVPVPGTQDPSLAHTDVALLLEGALNQVAQVIVDTEHRVDEGAQAVLRDTTASIQAKSYRIQSMIEEMQFLYDDPKLAEQLLKLDQTNEENLRQIQATGVLCGAWPGLTRADSHLGDIVAGAQSRIPGYQRVQVTSQLNVPVGVVARAVEPLAVIVAELLANAVHHTPQGTRAVDVSLHQVQTGACVLIDDPGVGMTDEEREFAARMLSNQQSLLLTHLGDPPRAGFATIGRLVKQFGFTVTVDKPSAYGGVRAVVWIPDHLLMLMDEVTVPMSAMSPALRRPAEETREPRERETREVEPVHTGLGAASGSGSGSGSVTGSDSDAAIDLPRRRRQKRTTAQDQQQDTAPAVSAIDPEQAAQTWGAWHSGTQRGVEDAQTSDEEEGSQS